MFPLLRAEFFNENGRNGYMELKANKDKVRDTIYHNPEFIGFDERIKREFDEVKELLEFCQ